MRVEDIGFEKSNVRLVSDIELMNVVGTLKPVLVKNYFHKKSKIKIKLVHGVDDDSDVPDSLVKLLKTLVGISNNLKADVCITKTIREGIMVDIYIWSLRSSTDEHIDLKFDFGSLIKIQNADIQVASEDFINALESIVEFLIGENVYAQNEWIKILKGYIAEVRKENQ